jgi:hypothetical protein
MYTKTHVTFKAVLAHYCSLYAVFAGEVGIYMPIINVPNITVVSGMKYNNVNYYIKCIYIQGWMILPFIVAEI